MDAIETLKRQFAFSQEDDGLEPYRLKLTKSDKRWCPAIAHASDLRASHVVFDSRDSYSSVQIYQVVNGHFPMTAGGISHAKGYR